MLEKDATSIPNITVMRISHRAALATWSILAGSRAGCTQSRELQASPDGKNCGAETPRSHGED